MQLCEPRRDLDSAHYVDRMRRRDSALAQLRGVVPPHSVARIGSYRKGWAQTGLSFLVRDVVLPWRVGSIRFRKGHLMPLILSSREGYGVRRGELLNLRANVAPAQIAGPHRSYIRQAD